MVAKQKKGMTIEIQEISNCRAESISNINLQKCSEDVLTCSR
jgi:hypothetical protein